MKPKYFLITRIAKYFNLDITFDKIIFAHATELILGHSELLGKQ